MHKLFRKRCAWTTDKFLCFPFRSRLVQCGCVCLCACGVCVCVCFGNSRWTFCVAVGMIWKFCEYCAKKAHFIRLFSSCAIFSHSQSDNISIRFWSSVSILYSCTTWNLVGRGSPNKQFILYRKNLAAKRTFAMNYMMRCVVMGMHLDRMQSNALFPSTYRQILLPKRQIRRMYFYFV